MRGGAVGVGTGALREVSRQDGKVKGKVNLLPFKKLADMQARPVLLEDMIAVLEDREMPPEDEPATQAADREQLIEALRGLLSSAAKEQAFWQRRCDG